jgi:hypothetical protein
MAPWCARDLIEAWKFLGGWMKEKLDERDDSYWLETNEI